MNKIRKQDINDKTSEYGWLSELTETFSSVLSWTWIRTEEETTRGKGWEILQSVSSN